MTPIKIFPVVATLLLSACVPHSVVVHDGLLTTVVDAASLAPVADALVFSWRDDQGRPIVLARSDESGRVSLQPEQEIRFVPLLSEGYIPLMLTVCKAGYEAQVLVTRAGWNADFLPARVHEVEYVPLTRSLSVEDADCRPALLSQ